MISNNVKSAFEVDGSHGIQEKRKRMDLDQ